MERGESGLRISPVFISENGAEKTMTAGCNRRTLSDRRTKGNSSDSPSREINNCNVSEGHICMQFCETKEQALEPAKASGMPTGGGEAV